MRRPIYVCTFDNEIQISQAHSDSEGAGSMPSAVAIEPHGESQDDGGIFGQISKHWYAPEGPCSQVRFESRV